MKKILVVRFSSFGDVVQAMNAARELKNHYPDAELHWLTKDMFKSFLIEDKYIDYVHGLESDFQGSILNVAQFIRKNKFDLIYDAHKNLRTFLLKLFLWPFLFSTKWLSRPKSRWKRFLFFKLRINKFPTPFFSRVSYLEPLEKIMGKVKKDGFSSLAFDHVDRSKFQFIDEDYLVFAPSAAWEMKRWPIAYWKNVIEHFSSNRKVVLVGGPSDHFIEELFDKKNKNIFNLAGKISFVETFFLVSRASYTLSADTGVIHCADLIGAPGGLLLGPTAFGRTYSSQIHVFEKDLPCRPCSKDGRGKCSQTTYQKCMVDIGPDEVIRQMESLT